jgi:hypothetical protein
MPELVPEDLDRAFIKATSLDADAYTWSSEFVASLILRIARAEQALTEERQHADELYEAAKVGATFYALHGGVPSVIGEALAAHDVLRKQERAKKGEAK